MSISVDRLANTPNYQLQQGIKIYNGTTPKLIEQYNRRINHIRQLLGNRPPLFAPLKPSTLTAQGFMTNISFKESTIFKLLDEPRGHIMKIGCNFGEKFNPKYKNPAPKKTSGRGRKPKKKNKSRRKTQGTGKYFASQITFEIEHPDTKHIYKIKLFRNGVFQVPGVREPSMIDLVKPIKILQEYLISNFQEQVEVENFMAVMRNYKSHLVNQHFHVNMERLEEIILMEKFDPQYDQFLDIMMPFADKKQNDIIKNLITGNYNPMNIAQLTYNTDKCFSFIIKFHRPSILVKSKKTTIKLLKKGKINFDGCNSQLEAEELYYWLQYMYYKHQAEILLDIRNITDTTTSPECSDTSVYSTDSETDDENELDGKGKPVKVVVHNQRIYNNPSRLIMNALMRLSKRTKGKTLPNIRKR